MSRLSELAQRALPIRGVIECAKCEIGEADISVLRHHQVPFRRRSPPANADPILRISFRLKQSRDVRCTNDARIGKRRDIRRMFYRGLFPAV